MMGSCEGWGMGWGMCGFGGGGVLLVIVVVLVVALFAFRRRNP